MRFINWTVSALVAMTGLMLVFYSPVPCGEEPAFWQRALDFGYFFVQNLVPFVFLLYIYGQLKNHYVRTGLILLGSKMVYEFFPLFGVPPNRSAHVFYMAVLLVVLITVLITSKKIPWETFRRK